MCVTIVLPTFDRPRFVERCLSHLVHDDSPFPILVADGSHGESAERNAAVVRRFSSRLNLTHRRFAANTGLLERLYDVVQQVATPFLRVHADDDLLFSTGTAAAAEALLTSDDVVAAQGSMMSVLRTADTFVLWPYFYAELQDDSPAARLEAHLHAYRPTFYSTFRTELFARALQLAAAFRDLPSRFQEIALSALTVLQGKTRFVPALYGLRTTDANSASVHDPSWQSIAQRPDFDQIVALFADVVGAELAAREGCSVRTARNLAKEALLDYLEATLSGKSRVLTEFAGQSKLIGSFFSGDEPMARQQLNNVLSSLD